METRFWSLAGPGADSLIQGWARNLIDMKWTKRSVLELIAVLAMTAVVVTLAILQYDWTKAISGVEKARMEGALDTSVKNFNQEFSYDFDRLCESFEIDPENQLLSRNLSLWAAIPTG